MVQRKPATMQSSHAESQIDGGKLKNIRHEKIYVSGTG